MISRAILKIAVFVAMVSLMASFSASAQDNDSKKTEVKQDKSSNATKDNKETATQVEPAKKTGEKKRFVDRDGDGIQDGMENRFRHRKGYGAKGKSRGEGRQFKGNGKEHHQGGGKPDGKQ